MMEQNSNQAQERTDTGSPKVSSPKVSLGVPVYNGENYLAQCLDSLLAQTFTDFEIIISDNGSSDSTPEICRAYEEKDARVRYFRTTKNQGAAWNFNRTLELAGGEYFKWAAHDDLCAPRFLEACVEVLDQDLSVSLCFSNSKVIDDCGEAQAPYEITLQTDSPEAHVRYWEIVRGIEGHMCYEIFGLIRMSALKNSDWMGNYPHGDGVLLARLALLGRFCEVPEALFYPRAHAKQSAQALSDRYDYAAWFDTQRSGRIIFPTCRMFWEYFRQIGSAPVSLWQRLRCYWHCFRSSISYRRKFLRDFVQAWRAYRHRRSAPRWAGSSAGAPSRGSTDR